MSVVLETDIFGHCISCIAAAAVVVAVDVDAVTVVVVAVDVDVVTVVVVAAVARSESV